ncbi:uncharacterized protein VTP21DRAFT_5248 [Calcarisporiella thermophila]|uniref:uncharacterized protein n=1 Tax=Calcarisporiella thermophila TaxID=911321 RepID=UPI0037423AD8
MESFNTTRPNWQSSDRQRQSQSQNPEQIDPSTPPFGFIRISGTETPTGMSSSWDSVSPADAPTPELVNSGVLIAGEWQRELESRLPPPAVGVTGEEEEGSRKYAEKERLEDAIRAAFNNSLVTDESLRILSPATSSPRMYQPGTAASERINLIMPKDFNEQKRPGSRASTHSGEHSAEEHVSSKSSPLSSATEHHRFTDAKRSAKPEKNHNEKKNEGKWWYQREITIPGWIACLIFVGGLAVGVSFGSLRWSGWRWTEVRGWKI